MSVNLPTDLLRSFAAIAELGSFERAATRVHRTQAAVSLQIRRLEELLQVRLFRRVGRRMVLSDAGEQLLPFACRLLATNDEAVAALGGQRLLGRVRLGTVQDFADGLLPKVLAAFGRCHPRVGLEVQVGGSQSLGARLLDGDLDMALLAGCGEGLPNVQPLPPVPMRWVAATGWRPSAPLPLLLLDPPCCFRDAAVLALATAGLEWRPALSSPSLEGMRGALMAGLGITCRTDWILAPGLSVVSEGLPPLPSVRFALARSRDGEAVERLAAMLHQACCQAVAAAAMAVERFPTKSENALAF